MVVLFRIVAAVAWLLLLVDWFFALDILFLEFGQKAGPILGGQGRILFEFPLNHESLNVVDGMDVVHAVQDDLSCLFESLVRFAHDGDRVALHKDKAFRQQLEGLESGSVRSD